MNIKYEKSVYQAKISQLEGHHNQLNTHLGNMENLRNKLTEFWDDKNAQATLKVLNEQIRAVKVTMTQTATEISVLKSTVEKLGGLDSKQEQELDTAFKTLEAVADFIPN